MTGQDRRDDRVPSGLMRPSAGSTPPSVRLTGWDPDSCCTHLRHADVDDTRAHAETEGMGRRLLIALLAFLALGAVGLVLALAFEIVVPPMMWLACVGFLIFGVLAAGAGEDRKARAPRLGDGDGARPIGCCSGPRPLGRRH